MRSAPTLKNMFLDCIRKIIPANCTHILQKAFFKHALVYYSLRRKKSIYFFSDVNFFDLFFSKIQRVFTISRLIYLRFIFIIEKIVRRNEMDNNLDNNQGGRRPDKGDPRRDQDPNRNKKNHQSILAFLICLLVTLVCFSLFTNMLQDNSSEITYDKFIDMVNNDEVKSVTLQSDNLTIVPKKQVNPYQEISYYTNLTEDETALTKRLEGTGIIFKSEPPDAFGEFMAMMLSVLLPSVLLFVLLMFFMRRMNKGGGGMMGVGKSRAKAYVQKETGITFKDVAGQDEAKESLQEVVEFLHNPGKYVEIGAKLPKGALLVGPPGTGKTLLAKAVAGEAHVPFFSLSGSEFVEMFVGVGASRVRDLFEEAKKNAPCIIFIDEIDAVARRRGSGLGGGHDEREQTLNQMLVEMDGFGVNEGIIMIAATNRVDILDPAILRPGRFDRKVGVGRPDVKGREEILKIHCREKPLGDDVDLHEIARTTAGFVGADLENLMNEAAIQAARDDRAYIIKEDIDKSFIKVGIGTEKKSRVVPESERRITAYHESGHAILFHLLPDVGPVYTVSIIPTGTGAAGYTMPLPENDNVFMTKGKLIQDIMVSLGGRIAEELILDDITTGASQDIKQVTQYARAMVTKFGMSDELGLINYDSGEGDEVFLGKEIGQQRPYGEDTQTLIDQEVKKIVNKCYQDAKAMIEEHMDVLHKCAALLLEKERINRVEFEALFDAENATETEA